MLVISVKLANDKNGILKRFIASQIVKCSISISLEIIWIASKSDIDVRIFQ